MSLGSPQDKPQGPAWLNRQRAKSAEARAANQIPVPQPDTSSRWIGLGLIGLTGIAIATYFGRR